MRNARRFTRLVLLMFLTFLGTSCLLKPNSEVQTKQHLESNAAARSGEEADRIWGLEVSDFEGRLYFFEVTDAVLDNTPRWRTKTPFPPLSPRKAEQAARREAERIRPDVNVWWLDEIALRPIDTGIWCYVVSLNRGDIPITGQPSILKVPVLMDGRAVRATTQQHSTR